MKKLIKGVFNLTLVLGGVSGYVAFLISNWK